MSANERKSSWTSSTSTLALALPSHAISTASIVITIEAEEECERTPLLAGQWRAACRQSSYGGLGPAGTQFSMSHKKCDRRRYSSFGSEASSSSSSTATGNSVSSYTSTYYYEAKPHLCDVRLFAIFFILIAGFTIATYLLIIETRLPSKGLLLDLVTHDIWSKMSIPLTGLLNPANVLNVLILHTGGESCDSPINCNRLLNQMQKQHWTAQNPFELPYNFLVADDGQTYEVRGWDHLSGFVTDIAQNSSIVIGFLGNYTTITPNFTPLQSALSLIKESVRRKKLQQNYRIYGLRNITAHDNDAEALFRHIIDWPHFEKLINVL